MYHIEVKTGDFKMNMFTRGSLVGLSMVVLSAAYASANDGEFGIAYSSTDVDFSASGVTVGIDLEGVTWGGRIPISDNLYATLSKSDLDGDLLGFKFKLETTNFGAGMYFANDLDLEEGEGSRYSIGLTSSEQKTSAKINNVTYSDSENFTLVNIGFETAINSGSKLSFGVGGNVDDFNPMYSASASIKAGPGNFLIGYAFSNDTINTVKVESRQLSVGYSMNF